MDTQNSVNLGTYDTNILFTTHKLSEYSITERKYTLKDLDFGSLDGTSPTLSCYITPSELMRQPQDNNPSSGSSPVVLSSHFLSGKSKTGVSQSPLSVQIGCIDKDLWKEGIVSPLKMTGDSIHNDFFSIAFSLMDFMYLYVVVYMYSKGLVKSRMRNQDVTDLFTKETKIDLSTFNTGTRMLELTSYSREVCKKDSLVDVQSNTHDEYSHKKDAMVYQSKEEVILLSDYNYIRIFCRLFDKIVSKKMQRDAIGFDIDSIISNMISPFESSISTTKKKFGVWLYREHGETSGINRTFTTIQNFKTFAIKNLTTRYNGMTTVKKGLRDLSVTKTGTSKNPKPSFPSTAGLDDTSEDHELLCATAESDKEEVNHIDLSKPPNQIEESLDIHSLPKPIDTISSQMIARYDRDDFLLKEMMQLFSNNQKLLDVMFRTQFTLLQQYMTNSPTTDICMDDISIPFPAKRKTRDPIPSNRSHKKQKQLPNTHNHLS